MKITKDNMVIEGTAEECREFMKNDNLVENVLVEDVKPKKRTFSKKLFKEKLLKEKLKHNAGTGSKVKWTDKDKAFIIKHRKLGLTIREIAELMGRNLLSVKNMWFIIKND